MGLDFQRQCDNAQTTGQGHVAPEVSSRGGSGQHAMSRVAGHLDEGVLRLMRQCIVEVRRYWESTQLPGTSCGNGVFSLAHANTRAPFHNQNFTPECSTARWDPVGILEHDFVGQVCQELLHHKTSCNGRQLASGGSPIRGTKRRRLRKSNWSILAVSCLWVEIETLAALKEDATYSTQVDITPLKYQ